MITFSRQAKDKNGNLIGAFFITFNVEHFDKMIKDIDGSDNITIYIKDGLVVSSKFEEVGTNVFEKKPDFKSLLSNASQLIHSNTSSE